jgi:branched-chain amino acid transport system ATP-binding protein
MKKEKLLRVENLYASYGKLEVLHDVDFNISSGDRTLLIGPNGAGKSTLLKSISGLHTEYSGNIHYKDKTLKDVPTHKRVEMGISYLKQEKDIFPGLTVSENLRLGGYYLKQNIFKERLEEIIEYFSILKKYFDKRAGLLSGGERRTLGIAMILIKEPELLLLDEPTAGLAPVTAKSIMQEIINLLDGKNIALVVVEHKLSLILDVIRDVSIMVQGKFKATGIPAEKIKENPEMLDKYYFNI